MVLLNSASNPATPAGALAITLEARIACRCESLLPRKRTQDRRELNGRRHSAYAPTGSFEQGALANIGKNYWTFEPGAAISYVSSRCGFEVTAFTGFDFNTENGATDYQTGDQFYLDGTIAQHVPLFGGFIGAGANGFFCQQITGDGVVERGWGASRV